jgi:hypothetical protein
MTDDWVGSKGQHDRGWVGGMGKYGRWLGRRFRKIHDRWLGRRRRKIG